MAGSGKNGPTLKSADRAEENRSSAFSLLLVGTIGLILLILYFLDLLPVHGSGFSKYLTTFTMGVLFLVFLVMGCVSLKTYKRLSVKVGDEEKLLKDLEIWAKENLSAESLNATLYLDGEESPEEAFLLRQEEIKKRILESFPSVSEDVLDNFSEMYCDKLYPNGE